MCSGLDPWSSPSVCRHKSAGKITAPLARKYNVAKMHAEAYKNGAGGNIRKNGEREQGGGEGLCGRKGQTQN